MYLVPLTRTPAWERGGELHKRRERQGPYRFDCLYSTTGLVNRRVEGRLLVRDGALCPYTPHPPRFGPGTKEQRREC
jgi:hypothetical protein